METLGSRDGNKNKPVLRQTGKPTRVHVQMNGAGSVVLEQERLADCEIAVVVGYQTIS